MEDLLARGVANIIPGKSELEKALSEDRKLNIYLGIDPTATKIHLGHAVNLRLLQKFADLGHNVTFLIGDFTALVGDTSDKDTERPKLSREEIEENFSTYKEQAEKLIDFSKVQIRYNSEWNSEHNFQDLLKLSETFSLNDFISRELIKKRLTEGKSVGLSETFYPLMQAYDSYMLKTDIQIGGTDQTFNMQAGRTLIKNKDNRESYVITTQFLMGTDGRKMSKTWGNAIWLDDEPFEMYRKVMAINDELVRDYFILATNINLNNIPQHEDQVKEDPLTWKKKLAKIIVSELHGNDEAQNAAEEFERVVQHKEAPSNLAGIEVNEDSVIDDEFLVQHGLAISKSEAKRLFEQNAVSLDEVKIKNGEEITGEKNESLILRIGKKVIKLNID
jgi:tyrosyl-tRNA synthetase